VINRLLLWLHGRKIRKAKLAVALAEAEYRVYEPLSSRWMANKLARGRRMLLAKAHLEWLQEHPRWQRAHPRIAIAKARDARPEA
jgi:hypothetical protein